MCRAVAVRGCNLSWFNGEPFDVQPRHHAGVFVCREEGGLTGKERQLDIRGDVCRISVFKDFCDYGIASMATHDQLRAYWAKNGYAWRKGSVGYIGIPCGGMTDSDTWSVIHRIPVPGVIVIVAAF